MYGTYITYTHTHIWYINIDNDVDVDNDNICSMCKWKKRAILLVLFIFSHHLLLKFFFRIIRFFFSSHQSEICSNSNQNLEIFYRFVFHTYVAIFYIYNSIVLDNNTTKNRNSKPKLKSKNFQCGFSIRFFIHTFSLKNLYTMISFSHKELFFFVSFRLNNTTVTKGKKPE